MSEIRTNPFTGEMSLYAENRRNRPYEFVHNTERKHANSEKCPFCGGHEAWTPDAIYQDGPNGAWQMRVFPNKFPTVREDCTDAAEEPIGKASGVGRKRKKMLCFRHNTPVRFLFVGKHFAEQAVLSAHSLRHGCRTLRHNRQPHHLPMRMVHAHPCGGPAVFENLHILRICTIAEKMQSIL